MDRKTIMMLFLVIAIRYGFGQDDTSGFAWDPPDLYQAPDTVLQVMVFAPIAGLILGIFRVATRELMRPVLEPIRLR